MKLRWRRWLALAILVTGTTAAVAALYSPAVLRIVADRVAQGVNGLEFDSVDGRLATGIVVSGLRWRGDGVELSVDRVAADWRLLPALSRRLRIGTLAIGTVAVSYTPAAAETPARGPIDLSLPWDIAVRRATVTAIHLRQSGDALAHIHQFEAEHLRLRNGVLAVDGSQLHWSLADGPAGTLSVRGRSDADLVVRVAADDGSFEYDGALATVLATPALRGQLHLRDLEPAILLADAPAMTVTGELQLDGWLESLALRGSLRIETADLGPTNVQLDARWGHELLVVREFTLAGDAVPVRLAGSGRADWSSAFLSASVRARWQSTDPAWFSPSGELHAVLEGGSVTVAATGELLDGAATLDGAVEWPVNPQELRGHARLTWSDIDYGKLSSSGGSVLLRGSYSEWRATLADAVVLFDADEISISGEVVGTAAAVTTVDLRADAGAAQARLHGTLAGRWDLAWQAVAPELGALNSAWSGPLRAEGRVQGTPQDLALVLAASTAHGEIELDAQASWEERTLSGTLDPVTITVGNRPPWRTDEPIAFELAGTEARVARACWSQEGVRYGLCLEGTWSTATGARIQAELARVTLTDLRPWLPDGLEYDGAVGGDATILVRPGEPTDVAAALTLAAGSIQQAHRGELTTLLRWRKAIFNGRLDDGAVVGDLRIILAEGGDLQVNTSVPVLDTATGTAADRPLHVALRGELSALDLLPALVPEVGTLHGVIQADVLVQGTRAQPTFTGSVNVADGVMTLPTLGLRLTELTATVSGDRQSLALEAHARSGAGTLDASGAFRFEAGRLRGDAALRGDAFQAVNLPEAEVHLAPDLTAFIDGHTVLLGGSMHIPFARLEPRDRVGAVRRSGDEIVVDAGATEDADDPWRLHARVRVTVADATVDGYGLSGRISGALTVSEAPGQPTRASGSLQIDDGRYTAWGQQLTIERGRLLYSGGPISAPGLDVRAVRRPRDVMVGVNVRGTLSAPELRLISEPPMEQAELLSWLVLGMPLQQTTGNDRQLLDSATRSAGLAGGELLAREIGRRLGLSDVGIEHGAQPEQAALVIGHYLSPRVYVAWGMGIFDNEQSLRLRYHLNRLWSIEAQTGERATSADIKYSVER